MLKFSVSVGHAMPKSGRAPRLYSYIIPSDDGAAPNPFDGMCTLTICKPKIRSSAAPGDWIAGVGSKKAFSGDLSGRLVYAMRVSEVVSLADYERRAAAEWPNRIPDIGSMDLSRRLGDCIYDYSRPDVQQRPGVHNETNVRRDIRGKNALIAKTEFYYFGSRAVKLPKGPRDICPTTQGHRSRKNHEHLATFEEWIRGLGLTSGQLYGWPDQVVDWAGPSGCGGCSARARDDSGEC